MTNEIMNLLPSQKLKDKIRETGHIFSEAELIYIISMYAPSFDKKFEMLSHFAEVASPEAADAAQKFIEYYKAHYNAFFGNSDGAVYKVKIWQDTVPGVFNEDFSFLSVSYEAALKGIDRYYKEYEKAETEKARYKIIKKHLFTGNESEEDEFPDYLGECWLGTEKVLLEVDDDSIPHDIPREKCPISPDDAYDLKVPNFLFNRDIVLYECGNKTQRLGVILEHNPRSLINYLYVVPLDSDYIRNHQFEEAHRSHSHPYAHSVIVVTPDDLPEEDRENYFAYMKYLDEHPEE